MSAARYPAVRSNVARMICSHQASPRSGSQPVSEHISGAALHDVEEPMAVHVDDMGREHLAMLRGGVQEPLLIDTDPTHPVELHRLVIGRVGVVRNRGVRGVPVDPVLHRCGRHREPVDVHHRRQPFPRSFGQRRSMCDQVELLGPGTQ